MDSSPDQTLPRYHWKPIIEISGRQNLHSDSVSTTSAPSIEQFSEALTAVGDLIEGVREEQWSAPTPCTDWTVRALVNHLIGMNLVFVSLLGDQAPPERGADRTGNDPAASYRESASALIVAFNRPGVLERTFHGPLGSATGMDRLQIRLYDLLAHGWDLAHAIDQPVTLPQDLAEQSLAFAQIQLSSQPRAGRFDLARDISNDAPAIDRLAAFLGRSISGAQEPH